MRAWTWPGCSASVDLNDLMDLLPPFPGFTPAAFAFLLDLAANNDRAWFQPRKATFEDEVRWPLRCLVAELAAEARLRRLPYVGSPDTSLFRIYRDTRFSKDKTPYKTHTSAWLSETGDKDAPGGFYVRIKPGACLLAVGLWQPERGLLARIRTRLSTDPGLGDALTERLAAAGLTFTSDDALKRLPRGFEHADGTPAAQYLRWKTFIAEQPVPDEATYDRAFLDRALAVMEAGRAVLDLAR